MELATSGERILSHFVVRHDGTGRAHNQLLESCESGDQRIADSHLQRLVAEICGQRRASRSLFSRRCPLFSTSTTSRSKHLGVSATGSPLRSNRRSSGSRRNGRNSYKCLPVFTMAL